MYIYMCAPGPPAPPRTAPGAQRTGTAAGTAAART